MWPQRKGRWLRQASRRAWDFSWTVWDTEERKGGLTGRAGSPRKALQLLHLQMTFKNKELLGKLQNVLFFRIDTFKTLFPAAQKKHSYQFLIKLFWSKKGQSQRMLGHRDVSQGELGQEAGCIGEHQNAMPTTGRCRERGSEPQKPGRAAFVPQSQAGNLCSRTDTELELSILWIKPRIKGRMQDSADKMFKARTQGSHLQKWVRKRTSSKA